MHNIIKDFIYSIFPQNTYLTYGEGNSPIILSAPHGGAIQPINIPKRTWGNRSRDTYTRRLIQLIIEKLPQKPYYIYSDIHRNRVDLNRDIKEAAQGNPKAEKIWSNWNEILNEYCKNTVARYGKALYVDIHSHNNSDQFQIGYGLKVNEYLDCKAGWDVKSKSTMSAFSSGTSESKVLFGRFSFPTMLEFYGYKVLEPKNEKNYLNGGRNIHEFHSNLIGAIQIECPIPILKTDLENVATHLAYTINLFKEKFVEV